MERLEEQRKRSIVEKRMHLDRKITTVQQQKDEEVRYRKEIDYLKRRDRLETVERMQRIQEYERDKVMQKIQSEDIRTYSLKAERNNLLAARKEMRSHADK